MSFPSTSVGATLANPVGTCTLTYQPLDTDAIIKSVQDDAAGAIAVFIGTTRNSFKGKVVTRLEYQAYSKLAIKTMADILEQANQQSHEPTHAPQSKTSLIKGEIHHRLGTVPVGEPSIVIAVSSPHRKEAFVACEYILEEVKQRAQIWKREFYEGEDESTAQWKENYEAA
ncbi:molybdenum cofactor synthesis 2 [Pluteus cervinus]|uniref:Molybdenum cofactor synthesis 2 n=1 Tax=Pluteus cervinus TaxID=181527 RepID=A0ACD3BHL7_9AGAR|nr:molybdenum cofactor synthesis 2 [Pluteus cervinus]